MRFGLEPEPGVTFELLAKDPSGVDAVRDVAVTVDFAAPAGQAESAYERIFADALAGDPRQFAREDTVEEEWRIVDPVLDAKTPPEPYERGGWGPSAADRLTADGHWIPTWVRP